MAANPVTRFQAGYTPTIWGELTSVMQKSDAEISAIVVYRLPHGSYSCVNVHLLDVYNFAGFSSKPARLISLAVSQGHYCSSIFYAIFSGIGIIDSQRLEGTINKAELQNQLITHICGEPREATQIERAYARCTDIDLYIAIDLTAIELKMRESAVIMGVYQVTKIAKQILPILIPMLVAQQTINQ